MGDWKMECPGCKAWTNSAGIAHRDGGPCPHCGLPWEATAAVLAAREKFAEDERTKLLEEALVRAGQAESDRDRYRAVLERLRERAAASRDGIDRVLKGDSIADLDEDWAL
jgi:hypothetical protein